MKIALRMMGMAGLILFGVLFAITYGVPATVEESAKGFVKQQIEREVREKYQAASASTVVEKARKIASDLGYEEQQLQDDINNRLPEKIAEAMASLCGYDCEKKKAIAQSITARYLGKMANLQNAQNQLGQIVKGRYVEIVGNLKADLRIFLGSNLAMFSILLAISLLKPRAVAHLFLPGIFLLVSTVVAAGIYLFGQDWFYTIVYNDYMGFGYLAYISLIFGFLMDVVFNRTRVTTEIINQLLSAIGSAFSVVPC